MNKIRAIIADDEPLARRGIRQMLKEYRDIDVIAEARNGLEAVRAIRELKPDLVFLDIQMRALDGFGVLRTIGTKQMPPVIFVTAHDEYAVKAFDAHALDYLVKPLQKNRFGEAIERIRERQRSVSAVKLSSKLSAFLAAHAKERFSQRMVVPTSTGDLIIEADEIDWIEADDYYAAIHACGQRLLVRESLTSLAQRLDSARFLRVHRSAIVNVDRVRELRSDTEETVVVLRNGVHVPVSRRRRSLTRKIVRRINKAASNTQT